MMRCCDCEFKKDCEEVESDIVAFTLCGMRMKKLIEKEMEKKYAELAKADYVAAQEGEKKPTYTEYTGIDAINKIGEEMFGKDFIREKSHD